METEIPRGKILSTFFHDHPESVAITLMKSDSNQISNLIKKCTTKSLVPALSLLPVGLLEESLAKLDDPMIANIITQLRVNLVGAIFHQWNIKKRVDSKRAETILLLLKPELSQSIKKLLEFPISSIGSVMNPTPFSVRDNLTAGEVLSILKKEKARYSRYIYVVNENSTLHGVVPFKEIFYAKKDVLISSLMTSDVFTFNPENSIKKSFDNLCWRKWHTIPVVDREKQLVGLIRFETLEEQIFKSGNSAIMKNGEVLQAGNAISEVFQIGISATFSSLMLPLDGSKKP